MKIDLAQYFPSLAPGMVPSLVETMVIAAGADGELGSDERVALASALEGLLRGSEHESMATGAGLDALCAEAEAALARDGRELRLAAVKAALPDDKARTGALALAIAVTAADGIVRTSERELLLELAGALDVSPDVAADLVILATRGA